MNLDPYNVIEDGRKVVTTAGTRERLTSLVHPSREVTITALVTNTDYVVVGGSTVVASSSTRQGIPLSAGSSITLKIDDLNKLFIDSVVSGEGISFISLKNI